MSRFVTYSLPRPFFGLNIPISIQSAYLRDYAVKNELEFTLPTTEICFDNSYYSLSNILRALKNDEHFGAVSILVLPLNNSKKVRSIMDLIKHKSIKLHFPLEGFCGSSAEVLNWCEEFIFLRSLQASNDQQIIEILSNGI